MTVAAIIVAGGRGHRAGGERPKQLQFLLGRPVYAWSVAAFLAHSAVDETVLVVPEGRTQDYDPKWRRGVRLVEGGATRSQSVRNGLAALTLGPADRVLIHDAARPGLQCGDIDQLLVALDTHDAAAPALIVSDALKRRQDGQLQTVLRDHLYRVQTPQAFHYAGIRTALEAADTPLVDDLAAVEQRGARIALTEGRERLSKITYPGDFEHMERLLQPPSAAIRVGTGYDVHAFEPGTFVTLCGCRIPHDAGLAGHSDADVGWHALTDAIFGALALGDLGDHFPPSDPKWEGADSAVFLSEALRLITARGYALESCDLTIICEAPKVKPHRQAMIDRTAIVTGLSPDRISIKATTTEGLGFTGRREGMAAQAVAVLAPTPSMTG